VRIAIVTGPFQPLSPGPAGAVEKLWLDLGREFERQGHPTTMVSKQYRVNPEAHHNQDPQRIACRGFTRSSLLAMDLVKDLVYSFRATGLLPQSDIVVTNTFWLPIILSIRKPHSARIVVSVERFPKGQMWLYWRAARLLAPSRSVADAICRQAPMVAEKVKVVPNPVDLETFRPPSGVRAQDSRVVVYAGRIHPEKGLGLLVRAFRLLSQRKTNLTLRLIGPVQVSEGGAGLQYAKRLVELGEGANIELKEPLFDRRRLCEEFHRATCFCYPSVAERGETFGVAPLEAMAAGLTPVVSALGCFRDYVIDGQTGVVFDHRARDRVERLAQALESVLFDDALRQKLRTGGIERARDFSTPRIAAMFLEDFQYLRSAGRNEKLHC
jgi:glycosyltransferase involved in cell wall biosynthesis